MSSLRRHEGELLIDHRDSPGVKPEDVGGYRADVPFTQGKFECATITCSHCQRVVLLNPDRSRERGYCRKCDHYICDGCTDLMAKTFECIPFRKILHEAQERAFQSERGNILLL